MARKIELDLQINGTGQAIKDFEKLDNQIDGVSDSLSKPIGDKSLDGLKSSLTDTIGKFEVFGVSLGDISKGFKGLINPLKGATLSTKGFGLALAGTGIGAIVVALGGLIAAFLSTQEGADALSRVLGPLKVGFELVVGFIQNVAIKVFTKPKEALKDLGDFIVGQFTNRITALKNIFTGVGDAFSAVLEGDFSKAKESLEGVGSNFVDFQTGVQNTLGKVKDAITDVVETSNELEDLKLAEREVELRNAQLLPSLQAEIEALRIIASDTSKSKKERTDAANEAISKLNEQKNAELDLLNIQIQSLELKQSLNDTSAEEKLLLAELQAQRNTLEAETLAKSKQLNTLVGTISEKQRKENEKNAQQNEAQRIQDEQSEQEKRNRELLAQKENNINKLILDKASDEEILQARLEFLQAQRDIELQNEDLTESEKLLIKSNYDLQELELETEFIENKNALRIKEEEEKQRVEEEEAERRKKNHEDELQRIQDEKEKRKEALQSGLQAFQQFSNLSKGLSDALFASKLQNVEKGSKEEKKILKKQFKVNKGFQIANALIGGIQGAIQAFNSLAGIPIVGPILGGIAAAAVGATTAIQVATISKTKFNPDGGGDGAGASDVPTPPDFSSTLSEGSGVAISRLAAPETTAAGTGRFGFGTGAVGGAQNIEGIGNTGIERGMGPQRVYVVESDITSTQNRVNTIESDATIG